MDISKIRKKAREQEGSKEEKPVESPAEPVEALTEESPAVIPEEKPVSQSAESQKEEDRGEDPGEGREVVEEVTPGEDGIVELLTFSLSGGEFAFRVSEVEEIIKYQKATRVPTLPDYVSGITSLRGKIIPVVNLKKRLKFEPSEKGLDMRGDTGDSPENGTRQKILILSGPRGLIGADIDNILGVLRFPGGRVLDPPAHLSEEEIAFIEGVVILEKRFISIFRSEEILDIGAG